jgi:hypothetical protein
MVEQLLCKQTVEGSTPFFSTKPKVAGSNPASTGDYLRAHVSAMQLATAGLTSIPVLCSHRD